MRGNTFLGILIPLVFCGFVLILAFLWMKRRSAAAQLARARDTFVAALASKGIEISPALIRTERDTNAIVCEAHYGRAHFAYGEYHSDGRMFVGQYCNPNGDRGKSFWYPATPAP